MIEQDAINAICEHLTSLHQQNATILNLLGTDQSIGKDVDVVLVPKGLAHIMLPLHTIEAFANGTASPMDIENVRFECRRMLRDRLSIAS